MRLNGLLQSSQSCLISLVMHLCLLVGLGLFSFSEQVFGDLLPLVVAPLVEEAAIDEFAIEPVAVTVVTPESAEVEQLADLTVAPKMLSDAVEPVDVETFAAGGSKFGLESLDRIPIDIEVAARPVELAASAEAEAAAAAMAMGFGHAAHAAAAKRVGAGYGDTLLTLRELPKDYVIVVRGAHDQMEMVLAHYKIPHTAVDI